MQQKRITNLWVALILCIGSIIMLAPFVWTISTSLKDQRNVFEIPPKWIPDPATFKNYVTAWNDSPLLSGFMNSMIIVVFVLVIGIFVSTMAAYAFAKIEFPFKDAIFLSLLGTMMIPFSVVMIPQFIGFSSINWTDTLLPLIVPGLFGNIVVIFFLRQYLAGGLPNELVEAAKLDGSGFFRTFWTIALRLQNLRLQLKQRLASWAFGMILWDRLFI